MEGVSRIDNEEMCTRGTDFYETGRKYSTADVNAVIKGLKSGGATQIDILDGHNTGNNLIADEIDDFATYLEGCWDNTLYDLIYTEKFAEYDAVALIGHHSQVGTKMLLMHILSFLALR